MFTADFFGIPLSEDPGTDDNSLTIQEVHEFITHVFEYVFLDVDSTKSYKHRVIAQRDIEQLAKVVRAAVNNAASLSGTLLGQLDKPKDPSMAGFGRALIKRLLDGANSKEDVVWELIPTQAGSATLAQAVS
jgi:hypothetical protein